MLYAEYGDALVAALDAAPSLREQMVAWLEVSAENRGVVRASQELMRKGTSHLRPAEELRSRCAALVADRLRADAKPNDELRGASLMIVDILAQYALMDAAGWVPPRDPKLVSSQLEWLVQHGLYKR